MVMPRPVASYKTRPMVAHKVTLPMAQHGLRPMH